MLHNAACLRRILNSIGSATTPGLPYATPCWPATLSAGITQDRKRDWTTKQSLVRTHIIPDDVSPVKASGYDASLSSRKQRIRSRPLDRLKVSPKDTHRRRGPFNPATGGIHVGHHELDYLAPFNLAGQGKRTYSSLASHTEDNTSEISPDAPAKVDEPYNYSKGHPEPSRMEAESVEATTSQASNTKGDDVSSGFRKVDSIAAHARFDAIVWQANQKRERDGLWPRLYVPMVSRSHIRDVAASWDQAKLARGSRRHKFLSEYHNMDKFPPAQEWRNVLGLLVRLTPAGSAEHEIRTETMQAPDGAMLQWTTDSTKATLEILERTGSQLLMPLPVETLHKTLPRYSSFTLTGNAAQNRKALQLIDESRFFKSIWRIGSENYLALRNSKQDATNGFEHSFLPTYAPRDRSLTAPMSAENNAMDMMDQYESMDLERAVSHLTSAQPNLDALIGPSWYQPQAPEKLADILEAALAGNCLPHVSISTTVYFLTMPWSDKEHSDLARRFRYKRQQDMIGAALTNLLETQSNIPLTTTSSLRLAWRYLAHARLFLSIRKIIAAHDEFLARSPNRAVRIIDEHAFNLLLASSVKTEDLHTFRYFLKQMKVRKIPANSESWLLFYALTIKCFPDEAGFVELKMRDVGVLSNQTTLTRFYQTKAPLELAVYLSQVPAETSAKTVVVDKFLDSQHDRYPEMSWLQSSVASKLSAMLLKYGRWHDAMFVVHEMLRQRIKPHSHLLWVFLSAAARSDRENAQIAVEILQRFEPLMNPGRLLHKSDKQDLSSQERAPTAQGMRLPVIDTAMLPDAVHSIGSSSPLRIRSDSYESLFNIAYTTRHWNLLRVIWQHACCAGEMSPRMVQAMYGGLHLAFKDTAKVRDMQAKRFFNTLLPRFAMDIGSQGVNNLPRLQEALGAGTNCGPLELSEMIASQRWYWLPTINQDRQAFGRVQPTHTLAEDALAAWRMDVEWQDQGLGTPEGIDAWGSPSAMLQAMTKRAFRVEVKDICKKPTAVDSRSASNEATTTADSQKDDVSEAVQSESLWLK